MGAICDFGAVDDTGWGRESMTRETRFRQQEYRDAPATMQPVLIPPLGLKGVGFETLPVTDPLLEQYVGVSQMGGKGNFTTRASGSQHAAAGSSTRNAGLREYQLVLGAG